VLGDSRSEEVNIRIRRMMAGDLRACAEILRESSGAARWSQEALENSLENKGTLALVSEQDGEVTGLIVGAKVGDEGEILNLAVKDGCRRKGVGKTLVEEILVPWAASNLGRIFLEVRESNSAALELYDGLGFRRVGRRAKYYRNPEEDALVLAWSPHST
jgi:[ribosomal protein S18]-alanine N-acetyltransferase